MEGQSHRIGIAVAEQGPKAIGIGDIGQVGVAVAEDVHQLNSAEINLGAVGDPRAIEGFGRCQGGVDGVEIPSPLLRQPGEGGVLDAQ